MLKLKGQTESGEWVEFYLSDIETILIRTTWFGDGSIKGVDPSTIYAADDLRKAMLDEIKERLGYVQMIEDKVNGWGGYSEDEIDDIIKDMEAKL